METNELLAIFTTIVTTNQEKNGKDLALFFILHPS